MKLTSLTVCFVLLLLSGCLGEDPTPDTFSKSTTRLKARATSSPSVAREQSPARVPTRRPPSGPSLLEAKEIQAKLVEQSQQSLPEENLKIGSRPFEGSKPVRQRLIKPLPSDTDPETARLVEQILTFDPQEPEPVTRQRLAQAIRKLRDQGSFIALDAIADTLRSQRLLQQDGEWILSFFYGCLAPGTNSLGRVDFNEFKTKFEGWLEQNPNSMAARYGLTQSLISLAWEARGFGYASEVTEEGWKLFKERLLMAREVLEPVKDQRVDPYLLGQRIEVGAGLGASVDEVRKDFDRVVAIDPFHVTAAYRALGFYLQPRWYGSEAEHQKFVNESVARTKSKLGEGLYLVFTESPGGLKVDEARRLQAAKDMVKKNPRSFRYRVLCAEQILKFEGAEAAHAFYQEIVDGKTELPFSEGDRLRLAQRVDKEFGIDKNIAPEAPSGQSASMLGVRLGMSQEAVEKLLGPPRQVGRYGKADRELHYRDGETSDLYSLIVSGETGQVVMMAGAGARVSDQLVQRGMTYPELEKAIGPPSRICEQGSQADKTFYLVYEPQQLVISWRASDQKAFIFQVRQDTRRWLQEVPAVTMQEWKKFWRD